MKIIFAKLALALIALIPKGKFKPVTYWKHLDNKYLYLCMSEQHIKDELKFKELFSKSIRISKFEFEAILLLDNCVELVTVADDKILGLIENKQ